MTDYDTLITDSRDAPSVFADKQQLDPLYDPPEIAARAEQEAELGRILAGINDGYLPTTVSIHGPPGTGKTLTTRRVTQAFADAYDSLAVEYVNLKECRSIFSVANELLYALTGEKKGAYEGLDGVFDGIWTALADYPAWTVLLLDEIDHIAHDANYAPSDFFYRLLRGEGKQHRHINLSAWVISNELLEVDLRLDSRVTSVMSNEELFFPPYNTEGLYDVIEPRLTKGFQDDALPPDTVNYGVSIAAARWGDARKTLTLFREAGETANNRGLDTVTKECIDDNLETPEKTAVKEKLLQLPAQHFLVLDAATNWTDRYTGETVQPVTTEQIKDSYTKIVAGDSQMGTRALRNTLTDLETMGLIDTWIESRGRDGRVKQIETTFDPDWIIDIKPAYFQESPHLRE